MNNQLEYELHLLGVIPKPQPKQPPAPITYGWKPSYKGEEPPF